MNNSKNEQSRVINQSIHSFERLNLVELLKIGHIYYLG
ncbi:MAG: hypothetical protein ACI808_002251 [Paraglaciecola sp.]|jgi:hypothetical protein